MQTEPYVTRFSIDWDSIEQKYRTGYCYKTMSLEECVFLLKETPQVFYSGRYAGITCLREVQFDRDIERDIEYVKSTIQEIKVYDYSVGRYLHPTFHYNVAPRNNIHEAPEDLYRELEPKFIVPMVNGIEPEIGDIYEETRISITRYRISRFGFDCFYGIQEDGIEYRIQLDDIIGLHGKIIRAGDNINFDNLDFIDETQTEYLDL